MDKSKTKLIKLLNMMASDADGEALTASRLATKLAEEAGGWAKLIKGAASGAGTADYKRGYAKGYRAGLQKGTAASWVDHYAQPRRKPKPQNVVHDRKKVLKVFDQLFKIWNKIEPEDQRRVKNYMDFFETNHCLFLRDYDDLTGIAKRYWSVYE